MFKIGLKLDIYDKILLILFEICCVNLKLAEERLEAGWNGYRNKAILRVVKKWFKISSKIY